MGKIGFCWNKGKINKIRRVCFICEKVFYIWKSQGERNYCSRECYYESRKDVSTWNKGKKLSKEHKEKIGKSSKGKLAGSKNPNWKGGIDKNYPNEFRRYLRFAIKERDNFTCQMCGSNKGLVVHHKDMDKKNSNLNNLITLCLVCHGRLHNG